MRTPQITKIIRGAVARSGLTMRQLAKLTGISYQTIMQLRLPDPGSWRFCEWGAVRRYVEFTAEELEQIGKEVLK